MERDSPTASQGVRADVVLTAPNTPTPQTHGLATPSLDGLKPWQRRYVLAVRAGAGPAESCEAANISGIILREHTQPGYAAYESQFARACDDARAFVVASGGREPVREMAAALAGDMVADAYRESRDTETHPRDRIGNRRLVLESAGVIGAQAQQASVQATQINIAIQVVPDRVRPPDA